MIVSRLVTLLLGAVSTPYPGYSKRSYFSPVMPRTSVSVKQESGDDAIDVPAHRDAVRALEAMREISSSRRVLRSELSAVCLAMYNIETDYIPRSMEIIYATRKLAPTQSHSVGGKRQREEGGELIDEGEELASSNSLLESPLLLKRDDDTGDVVSIVGSCRGRSSFRNFLRNPFDKAVDLGENATILSKEEVKKGAGGGTPSSTTTATQPKTGGATLASSLAPTPTVPEGKSVFSSVNTMITAEDSRAYRKELLADHKRYLSLSYPPSFGLAERLRMERLKASRNREVVASLGIAQAASK